MEIKCIKQVNLIKGLSDKQTIHRYFLEGEIANISSLKQDVIQETDLTHKSNDRIKVICPIFYACGGCDFLHINYQKQLSLKESYVKDVFAKEQINVSVKPIIKNDEPRNYRHKVVLSATNIKQRLRLGLYRENTKKVIPFLDCHIQDKQINQVLKALESIFNRYKLPAYDIDSGTGIIKHVMVRKSYRYQHLMLIIVTQGNLLPNGKKIVAEIMHQFLMIKTVIQNIHRKKTHLVLLDEEKVLSGIGYIEDEIDGLRYKLSPKSFYQVNPMQMIKLYQKGLELLEIKPHEVVMDTYSGIGTISLLAAKKAKHVIAIETNKQAHMDALVNKKSNQISNITFVNEDVEVFMMNYHEHLDALILDPTREGSTTKFLHAVLRLKPKKILYISCEPTTQARDIKILMTHYDVMHVQPVDMFSQTVHVESITLLSLKTA